MIYLDQAATSFPKPPAVLKAVADYLASGGGSPGRSSHSKAVHAGRLVYRARESLARLFGVRDSRRLVFTSGATEGLNIAIFGMLSSGGHAVTTSMEHNSVMRPLRRLEACAGVEISVVKADGEGRVDPRKIHDALRKDTRLVVVNHGSNVTGALQDLREIRRQTEGTALLVDAAQTAGVVELSFEALGLDFAAFPGHKALLGPSGTGGLFIREGLAVPPLVFGGTGSESESEEQPEFLPDRFESGTLNVAGIAGLAEGVGYVLDVGQEAILRHERALTARLVEGLRTIPGVTLHGPPGMEERTGVVSMTVAGRDPSELALRLDREFAVLVRAGLQCSPASHRTIGTFPTGTLRFSLGFSNTAEEIDGALGAVEMLVATP